jgi:AraC-like DNA-binding protein
MSQNLSIFLRDEVQNLIDAFASCFAVKVTFFSLTMAELSVGLQSPGSRFCRLVQNELRLLYRCHAMDREMCNRAIVQDRMFRYRCHAGLTEVIIPIKVEGKTIGTMMVGQIRESMVLPADIVAAWTKYHKNEKILLEAWNQIEPFGERRFDNMLQLFTMLVKFIITQNYVTLREGVLIERVLRYIDEHIDEPILLSAAAAELGKSESAISHALKKKLNLGFKRVVNWKKIERFETILHKEPTLTIQEAVARVGFEDPLYFSRLYKKIRLVPPSTFLIAVRDETLSGSEMKDFTR